MKIFNSEKEKIWLEGATDAFPAQRVGLRSGLGGWPGNRSQNACHGWLAEATEKRYGERMFLYGKTAANAIAVISYLAAEPKRMRGSLEIAKSRKLSRALTAKLLTQLSTAGLVTGQPGPGGGYTLALPPSEINLLQVVQLFEQVTVPSVCPFGKDWCGNQEPCPLHHGILALSDYNLSFLRNTSLDVFLTSRAPARRRAAPARTKRKG